MRFHPGLHEGVDVGTGDFLRTKISWMRGEPNFLTHDAPLRALLAPRAPLNPSYWESTVNSMEYFHTDRDHNFRKLAIHFTTSVIEES